MQVTRREFVETFGKSGGINPANPPAELKGVDLTAIAGDDHVIRGPEEMGRLYDLLASARTTDGKPAFDLSKSGKLYAELKRVAGPSADPAPTSTKPTTGIGAKPPRRVHVELDNPLTSPTAHASYYAAVPRAIDAALDKFAQKYPGVNKHFGARFLEMSLVVGAEVPFMVGSHEYGHYRAGKSFGWDAKVELTGWANGITRYDFNGKAQTADQDVIASAAGMNQQLINGGYLYRDWSLADKVGYPEAIGYLLSQTNTALYAARTSLLENPPSKDDVASYVQRMNDRGNQISVRQLAAIAIASDLASAPVWAALIGSGRFLANGERSIEIPKFNLGSTELTFPNFHTYLSTKGPIVGGELFVNPRGKFPVQLSMDVRLEDGALALGGKVHELPAFKNVSINPFIRATASGSPGLLIGTDVTVPINSRFSLIGSASYNANDLRAEVEGRKSGLDLTVNIGITR